jgi:hypothetical protein
MERTERQLFARCIVNLFMREEHGVGESAFHYETGDEVDVSRVEFHGAPRNGETDLAQHPVGHEAVEEAQAKPAAAAMAAIPHEVNMHVHRTAIRRGDSNHGGQRAGKICS